MIHFDFELERHTPYSGIYTQIAGDADYRPGRPGRLSGPPESCYPPEPPEIEVLRATLDGKAINPRHLNEYELEQIEREIIEIADEAFGPDNFDDFDD